VSDSDVRGVLDPCGCCEAGVEPGSIWNRPGLPGIAFRIGTHASFMSRMQERIPRLFRELRTRDETDPSIAVLDGFATIADVLAFYQERIANEGFLRTATERRSVLELGRQIGYELNPGVAASAHLLFRVEERPPPPGQAAPLTRPKVPKGVKVQSMPEPGQLPQTYETSSDIEGRPEWNELRPRLTREQPLTLSTRRLYLRGLDPGLEPGDRILVTVPAAVGVDTAVLEVAAAVAEPDLDRTLVDLVEVGKLQQEPPPPPPFSPPRLPPAVFFLKGTPLTATHLQTQLLTRRVSERVLRAQISVQRWYAHDVVDFVDWQLTGGGLFRKPQSRGRRRFWIDRTVIFEPPSLPPPPPQIVSYSPGAGSTEIDIVTNVNVSFSVDMDPATISSANLKLLDPAGTAVGATVSYNAATRTATLDPTTNLAVSSTYSPQVLAGADGPKDTSGRQLASGATWSFGTAPDTTTPEIVDGTQSPTPALEEVAADTAVSVSFNEPMMPSSITRATFELQRLDLEKSGEVSNRLSVEATVTYDAASLVARLQPKAKLDYSARHEAIVHGASSERGAVKDVAGNEMVSDATWQFKTEDRPPIPPLQETAAFAFRERAGFFGNNAPRWKSLPKDQTTGHREPYVKGWDPPDTTAGEDADVTAPRTVWEDSQGNSYGGDKAYLERAIQKLQNDGWALFESPTGINAYWVSGVEERSLADYALSGRTSGLTLSQENGDSPAASGEPPRVMVRDATAHVRSERLGLAELPIDDPLSAGQQEIMLDALVLDLDEGQQLMLSGERHDLPGTIGNEVLTLEEIVHEGGFTTLHLREKLISTYVRRSVTISANVIVATHGESVPGEILGGGDGREANQRLTLRKPPLTYASAPTPTGSESTLDVRVNGMLWSEALHLYGLGPRDESYIVRIEDDGTTALIFGDGVQGARVPTGTENVVATYRSGIGSAGQVPAERLTLLQTRPAGIEAVTNPLPARGAADPESRDAARENAPRTVLAMDRIVSLKDVEDFGRAFAGIGKAQAVGIWRGSTRLIHLTVGAEDGSEVAPGTPLFDNLSAAIEAVREPSLTVVVDSYAGRYFEIAPDLVSDGRRSAADVVADAQQVLQDTFSFERRRFGQSVTAAEIISLLQAVAGVVAVDLRGFATVEDTVAVRVAEIEDPEMPSIPPPAFLPAATARLADAGTIEPAELLLINPAPPPVVVSEA